MEVSASMVKALRQETGAGFADCKQALAENAGDVAKARDWLRLRRSKLASKKSERATSEGVIAFAGDEADGVLIELLAETDFVANNEQFREVAAQIATALAKSRPTTTKIEPASLAACAHDAGTLEDLRQATIAKIGENIQFGRSRALSGSDGSKVFSYLHHNGKIGVIASVACADPSVGKDVCMQIAAMRPEVVSEDQYPAEHLAKLEAMFKMEVEDSDKPDEIKQKMVAGKLRKHFKERVLLNQELAKDDKQTVKQMLEANDAKILAFEALYIGA